MSDSVQSRRRFLRNAVGASAGVVALPHIVPSTVFGAAAPSERITIGCIGVGGMGSGNMNSFLDKKLAQVVAVCDVDKNNLNRAKAVAADAGPVASVEDVVREA